MCCNVYRKSGDSLLSIIRASEAPHYVVINGTEVKNYHLNEDDFDVMSVMNKFGTGKRLKLTGTTNGPLESVIKKILYIDNLMNTDQ